MLELTVRVGTQEFVYTGVDHIESADDLSISQNDTGTEIEMSEVSLAIDTEQFLGSDTVYEIPLDEGKGFRCVLKQKGVSIFNGRLFLNNISQEPSTRTWNVVLTSGAAEELYRLLEETLVIGGTHYDVDAHVNFDDGTVQVETVTFWSLSSMFNFTMGSLLNVVLLYQETTHFFELNIDYDDGGETKTISRVADVAVTAPERSTASPSYIPEWDALQLLETLSVLLGWRTQITYAPYPSDTILVRVITDKWLAPAIPLGQIEEATDSRYDIGREGAEEPDFALTYENKLNEAPLLDSIDSQATLLPSSAYYAASRFTIKPDGSPRNSDLQTIEVSLPQVRQSSTQTITPDPSGHPSYTEDRTVGTPVIMARGAIYIGEIEDVSGNKLVVQRAPTSPAAGQNSPIASYWCLNLFSLYQIRKLSRFYVDGQFDADSLTALPVVGDPLGGFRFKGIDFLIREMTYDPRINVLNLRGIARDARVASEGEAELPDISVPRFFVANLINEREDEQSGFVEGDVQLTWTEPVVLEGQVPAVDYEIQSRYLESDPFSALIITSNTSFLDQSVEVFSSALITHIAEYRIRARNGSAISDWVIDRAF